MNEHIKQLQQNIEPVDDLEQFYVYALWQEGEIVYIGQSMQVFARITTHRRDKEFDSYSLIKCKNELEMEWIEADLINHLKPKYNKALSVGYMSLVNFREKIRRISEHHRYSSKYYVARINEQLIQNEFELHNIDGIVSLSAKDIPAAMRCIVGEDYGG